MTTAHPTLEQLAKLLSGRLETDELLQEILPHFLSRCDTCTAQVVEIRRLQRQIGHWDELIALVRQIGAGTPVAAGAGRTDSIRSRQ